jgi:predicted PurR-regulated permease PerM
VNNIEKQSGPLRVELTKVRSAVLLVLFAVATFLLLNWAVVTLKALLLTIFLAWLFSVSMEPPVAYLERRKWRRGLATGAVMLGVSAGLVGFIALFGQLLFTQAASLLNTAPDIVRSVIEWVNRNLNTQIDPQEVIESLNLTSTQATDLAASLAGGILGFVSALIGFVINLLAFMLFLFYLSADAPKVRRSITQALPPKQQEIFIRIWQISINKAGGFVITRVVLALICFVVTAIFLLVIGIPYWLPIALFTAVVSQFIPTIGTYIGIALPALVALSENITLAIAVIIFGVIYQQIENFLLAPKLAAKALAIHPAVAFGAVLAGGTMFGAVGAFIAIPVMAIIVAIIQTYMHRYEISEA